MTFVSKAWLRYVDARGFSGHTPFGAHHETGDIMYVSRTDRRVGVYIVGQSSYGKSGLVENLALDDIAEADSAVAVFDYHGDLADRIVAATPANQLHRLFVFDMLDESWPIGLSLFPHVDLSSNVAVAQAANRILHLFHALWPETETQKNLPMFVRASVLTMLANDGTTLYDMYRMFDDVSYRNQLVAKVPWDNVRGYWAHFDHLDKADRNERSEAVINRLHALFMGTPFMQNILGQSPGRIDFKQIMADKSIILIKLPGRSMTYEARLVGGILLAQLQAAVFANGELAPEDRLPISVYLDEFQAFATPDLEVLYTEGRKYRIALTCSHQLRSQLTPKLRDATAAAKTVVCFRTSIDDSRELAPLFTNSEGVIQPADIAKHPVQFLLDNGSDDPLTQLFIDYYLRPLQPYRKGNQVEIRNGGWSLIDELTRPHTPVGYPAQYIRIPDPTTWLDDLLHRVMLTGNPDVVIPGDAVAGFANAGVGFFPQIRNRRDSDPIFQPDYLFPPGLVQQHTWLSEPENGREQLLHCIWVLRGVMEDLAANPVGKETKLSDHDTAQILRSLPVRAACVRSGDEQGVIFTLDNPPHLTGADLQQRVAAVRDATRATYCRPRHEVEQAARPHQVPEEVTPATAPQKRWEQRP